MRSVLAPYENSYALPHEKLSFHSSAILHPTISCESSSLNVNYNEHVDNYLDNLSNNFVPNDYLISIDSKGSKCLKMNRDHRILPQSKSTSLLHKKLASISDSLQYNTQAHTTVDVCIHNEELLVNNENAQFTKDGQTTSHMDSAFVKYLNIDSNAREKHHETMVNYNECHSAFSLPDVSPTSIFHHSEDRSKFYTDLSKDLFHAALHDTLKKDEKYIREQYSEDSTTCPFGNTRNSDEKPFYEKDFITSPSYTPEEINFIEPCKSFPHVNETKSVPIMKNDLTQGWGESNAPQDMYCVKSRATEQWPYQTLNNSTTHDESESHVSSERHSLAHQCHNFPHQNDKKKCFQNSLVTQEEYRSSLYKSFLTKTYSSPTLKNVQPKQQNSWLYSAHMMPSEKDASHAQKIQNYTKHNTQEKSILEAGLKNNPTFHYMNLLNTSKTSGDSFSNPFLQSSYVPLESSSPPMQPSCLPLESPCLFMENSPKDSIDHQQDLRVERQKDVSDIKKHALAEDAENSFCNVSSNDCLNDCVQNCEGTDSQCNVFSIDRTSVLQNSCLPQVSNKTYEKSTVNDCQISDTQDLDKANAKACWIGNKSGTLTDMSYSNPKKCFQEKFCFDELKTLGLFLAHIYALYQHTVCSKNCKSSLQNSVAWLGILDHYEDELLDFVSMCNERRDELNHVFLCKSSETEKDTGNELLKQENDFKTFEKGQNQDVLAHTFFVHSGVQDDKFLHCVAEWYQIKCHKGLFCNKTLKKEQEIKAPPLNNLTHTLVCDVQEKPQSSATPKILKYKNEKTCESVSGSYQITKLFFECLQALKELKDIFGGARHIQSDIDLSSYYLRSAISAYQKHDLRKDTDEEKTALRNMYKANCLHEGELDSLLYSDSTCTGISHRMCETGRCEKASCFYDAALSTPRMQSIRNVLKNKTLDNRVHDDGEQEKGTYETAQAGVSQEISIQGQLGKENIVEKEFYPPSEHSNMVATQNIPFNSLPDQLCYEKASLLDTKKNTAVNHQQECLLILGFLKRASPQWAAHYHSHEWHSRYISVERNESIEMYMKIFLPQESFFALNTMSCHKNNLILSSSFILPMKNAFELLCLWFNRLDCFRLSHEPNFEPFFLIPSVEQKNYSQPFLSLSSDILNHVNFFLNDSAPKWKKYLDLRESQVVFSCNKRHNSTTPGVSTSPCREPSFFTPFKCPETKRTNTEHSSESQYTAQTSNGASTRKELDDISAVKNSMLMYPSLHDPPLVSFQKYETVSTCATPARLSMVSLNSACHNPQENVFMPFTPNLGKVTSQILSPVKITHKRKRRMVVMICTARPCSLPPSNETEDVKSLLSPSCKKLCLVTKPYHESSVPNFTQRICEKTSHTTFYNSFMYQPNNITFHDAKKNELNPYLASAFVSPTASLRFKNKKIPTQKQLHNEDKVTRLPICKKKKLSSKQQEDVSLEVQKLQATSTSDVFSSYPAYSEATKSSSPPTHDLRVMWNPQENAWVVAVAKEFSSLGYPIFCSFPVSRYGADMARYLAFQWKDQHDSSVLEERIVQHPSIITTHQICDQTSSTPPCQNTDEKKSSPPSPSNHTLPSKNTTQQRSTSRSSKYTTGNTRATTTCHSRNPPKSEIPGVYWYRNRNGWVAQWFEKGKNKHKFFAASAFGIEGAKEKAIAYRLMKLEEKRLKGW